MIAFLLSLVSKPGILSPDAIHILIALLRTGLGHHYPVKAQQCFHVLPNAMERRGRRYASYRDHGG